MGKVRGAKKEPKIVTKKVTVAAAVGTKGKPKKVALSAAASSKKKTTTTATSTTATAAHGTGKTMEEKILCACEFFYEMGITQPLRVEVAKQAGFKSIQTKTVRVCFQKNGPLALSGKVEFLGTDTITITQAGLNSIGHDFDRRRSNREMLDFIASLFSSSPSEVKVLNALSDGATYSVTELLKKTNYQREDTKSFRDPISKLKKLGYLEMSKDGAGVKMYRLTDKAFPEGRR